MQALSGSVLRYDDPFTSVAKGDCERWQALVHCIPAVAVATTRLPEPFHPEPADRFLVAQARVLNIPLVTADVKIRTYPHAKTLW